MTSRPAPAGAPDTGRDVTVRRAGPDDLPALVELRRRWTSENAGRELGADDAYVAAFAAWHQQEAHQRVTWLLEVDGIGVGMLNMLVFTRMPVPSAAAARRPRQWGYVANVYVDPAHRNRSLGRLLIEAAVNHADAAGFARLVLSPSERSVPFYERVGFRPATSLMVRQHPERADGG